MEGWKHFLFISFRTPGWLLLSLPPHDWTKAEHLVQPLSIRGKEKHVPGSREGQRRHSHPAIVQLPLGSRTRASSGHRIIKQHTHTQIVQWQTISILFLFFYLASYVVRSNEFRRLFVFSAWSPFCLSLTFCSICSALALKGDLTYELSCSRHNELVFYQLTANKACDGSNLVWAVMAAPAQKMIYVIYSATQQTRHLFHNQPLLLHFK